MSHTHRKLTVFYDGACPTCVRDRTSYEKLSGEAGKDVIWFDITGQDDVLRHLGIDPVKALKELHIKTENDEVLSEIDAYIVLMSKVPILRPAAWLAGRPLIRPILAKIYHRQVNRRLERSGRLPTHDQ